MRRLIKLCLYCNKEFFPLEGREETQKYCSKAHLKYHWKKKNWRKVLDQDNARARKKARKNWQEKNCAFCKKRFLPNLGNKNQQIYCSWQCRNKFNATPEKRKIWRKNWRNNHLEEIKRKDYEYKAKIRFGTTSKTLNKKIVLKRDNKTCKLCGNYYQVIHHIKYSGKHEDLVLLCRACHAGLHQRIKKPPYWIGKYKF